MAKFGPLTAEIGWRVCGTWAAPQKCRQCWYEAGTYTVSTVLGARSPNGILPGAKFTLRQNHALYWQRYCTALEQWASARLCGVVSSRDRAAIPFDIGRSITVLFTYAP